MRVLIQIWVAAVESTRAIPDIYKWSKATRYNRLQPNISMTKTIFLILLSSCVASQYAGVCIELEAPTPAKDEEEVEKGVEENEKWVAAVRPSTRRDAENWRHTSSKRMLVSYILSIFNLLLILQILIA